MGAIEPKTAATARRAARSLEREALSGATRRLGPGPQPCYVDPMRIHITAVAGTGMGALAGLLKELGHDVSGSDVAFYPPMGPALEEWGIAL